MRYTRARRDPPWACCSHVHFPYHCWRARARGRGVTLVAGRRPLVPVPLPVSGTRARTVPASAITSGFPRARTRVPAAAGQHVAGADRGLRGQKAPGRVRAGAKDILVVWAAAHLGRYDLLRSAGAARTAQQPPKVRESASPHDVKDRLVLLL
jgi:hypothetical protein